MTKKPKILFYDIETTPLCAWIWRLGEQTIRHDQLVDGGLSEYNIICITYCWNDDKPGKCIGYGYYAQNTEKVIRQFDKIIKKADITIGKNSDSFDVKHINTQRMLAKLPPMPEWSMVTDDLEKQMRKHFRFPSHSLDYVSKLLGFGGKIKMHMRDWVDIVTKHPVRGKKAYRKMCRYGIKDVEDTRKLWNRVSAYITPKFNAATFYDEVRCVNCGSKEIRKNGTIVRGRSKYQKFYCRDHKGYAGIRVISKSGKLGKIG